MMINLIARIVVAVEIFVTCHVAIVALLNAHLYYGAFIAPGVVMDALRMMTVRVKPSITTVSRCGLGGPIFDTYVVRRNGAMRYE